MVRYLVSMVTSGQSQKTNPLLSITLLNLLLNILNCIKMKRTIKQIPVYLLNPLKTLYFQGISPILCSNLMYFPLFLPLRAETRESFLLSADHLIQQSCGSTLRFPCSVSVNIHCGTDIGMSEKLLHILRRCPVREQIACECVSKLVEMEAL